MISDFLRMKNFLLILFVLFFSGAAHADDWRRLATGLSYKQVTVKSGNRSIFLNVLKVSPKKFALKPVYNADLATAETFAETSHAIAVVNANFFDTSGRVLGLVKKDNKVVNPKRDISWWGVFCVKGSSARVLASKNYQNDACEQALQSGPRLVVGGELVKIKDEISPKTAVGVTREGDVVIVATAQFLSIQKLASTMRDSEKNGGLGCVDALNFDGGSSTQMQINYGEFTLSVSGYSKVPVGLGVFRK